MKNKAILFIDKDEVEYIEPIKYSFPDCEISHINDSITPPEIEKLAQKINQQYQQVIFFDYFYKYYLLLPLLSKKIKVKWILTTSIPSLFNECIYNAFFQIIEYKERNMINEISTLDYNVYLSFKDKYGLSYLKLDINRKDVAKQEETVGIVGYDYIEGCSFFNELSAITLTKFKKVYVQNQMNVTKRFGDDFKLQIDTVPDIYELMSKNKVNMYINFYDTNIVNFLYSMDNNIPCLLGNTDILDNNILLKQYLVLESDDSIDEMADKIEQVIKNFDNIFKEYKKWRKQYISESKKLITEFMKK